MVHTRLSDNLPRPADLPQIPRPQRVLFTTPEYFQVEYTINPHMEGNLGDVDQTEAWRQWEALRDTYASLGFEAHTVEGEPDLPDMVFCANQTLPFITPGGELGVVLGRMHAPQRKPEVQHYDGFFRKLGYDVQGLDPDLPGTFEGMGDALWHPERYLVWGAYGIRTDLQVFERLSARFGFPVIALRLDDLDFYHLDTCFTPLDVETALIVPAAFNDEGLALLDHCFDRLIEVPEDEGRSLLAGNAHCPDGRHVVIQKGAQVTNERLREAGYEVIEVETGEFLKAGGSVFCMKLMFW